MRIIQAFGLAVALVGAACGVAFAQGGTSAPAPRSAEERAAQLREVVGLVTTPDRELNIANFEQIMESNDLRRIETAIRTLISSDDPALRGIAMRGYLSVTRNLVMDVVLSPNETRVLEEAKREPRGIRALRSPYKHLMVLADRQLKVGFRFETSSVKDSRGKVSPDDRVDEKVEYIARGDKITFRMQPLGSWSFKCDIELKPTSQITVEGMMSCSNPEYFPNPIKLTAPMY